MSRRGFTLVELLVVTALMGLIGLALVRMLINDSRFVSEQDAMLGARQAARAAMNVMTPELRQVGTGGLLAAAPESVVVRVPYAFGVSCGFATGPARVVLSLVPVDSLTYALATPEGLAGRDPATGSYTIGTLGTVSPSGNTPQCDADSVRVLPGGQLVDISGVPGPKRPPAGHVVYLFHTVRYKFAPSVDLPGRRALWRRAGSAAYEELVAPFDTAAAFAFMVGPALAVSATPPADLTTVRGLELRLTAHSVSVPSSTGSPEEFPLVTQVPFVNAAN